MLQLPGRFELEFVARRPRLWPGLVRSYARVLRGRPTLRSVELGLTYACPMSCGYCSADDLMQERGTPLSVDEWVRVIDEAIRLGALHFLFTGGDPLLAPAVLDLVRAVRARRRVVSLVTTGDTLNATDATALADAGLDAVEISLDGASPARHDLGRGRPGAFERALQATELFRARGVNVLLTHVATRETLRDGESARIADLARDRGFQLNLGFVAVAGRQQDPASMLTAEEWRLADALLERPGVRCCAASSYRGQACTAGSEKIYITRFGDLTPCPLIPAVRAGNVREASLEDLWNTLRRETWFRFGSERCLPAWNRRFVETRILASSSPGDD